MTTNEKEPRRIIFSIGTREQATMLFAECMIFLDVLQDTIDECLHHATIRGDQAATVEGLQNMLEAFSVLPSRLEKIAPIVSEEELAEIMTSQPNAPAGNC